MPAGYNEPPYKVFHASTAQTSTVVKPGNGILHTLTINNIGATGVTISLLDGATPIATIAAPTVVTTLDYDVGFVTSLVVSSTGTTPPDFTISFS
jgi:hypothetical protein